MTYEAQQLSRWLSMAELQAKRSIRSEVIRKAGAGECLICGGQAARRGLCHAHYMEFIRWLGGHPKRDRMELENTEIQNGRILASGQIRKIKKPSSFGGDA